jgi:hypothetical protein
MGESIKLDLKDAGREVVGWVHLAQNVDELRAIVYTVFNRRA